MTAVKTEQRISQEEIQHLYVVSAHKGVLFSSHNTKSFRIKAESQHFNRISAHLKSTIVVQHYKVNYVINNKQIGSMLLVHQLRWAS